MRYWHRLLQTRVRTWPKPDYVLLEYYLCRWRLFLLIILSTIEFDVRSVSEEWLVLLLWVHKLLTVIDIYLLIFDKNRRNKEQIILLSIEGYMLAFHPEPDNCFHETEIRLFVLHMKNLYILCFNSTKIFLENCRVKLLVFCFF